MDTDPWLWTVAQVVVFFENDAARVCKDKGAFCLPDLAVFIPALRENNIGGSDLLTSITIETLRDFLNVRSLGQANSVLFCIKKLRNWSASWQNENSGSTVSSSPPLNLIAPREGRPDLNPEASSSAPNAELQAQLVQDHVSTPDAHSRMREFEVEDQHGRKRRKLDLSAITNNQTPPTTVSSAQLFTTSLSRTPFSIDEVFYGSTGFGHEIGELNEDPATPKRDAELDSSVALSSTFTFHNQGGSARDSRVISSWLRGFWLNATATSFQRGGRDAVAIRPYSDRRALNVQTPSATVYQMKTDGNDAAAYREIASYLRSQSYLASGDEYHGMDQADQSSSQWDYLIGKWSGSQNETDIVVDELSESGQASILEDSDVSENEEEEAEEEDEEGLVIADASTLVHETIERFAQEWASHRQSKPEDKKVRTIWKQMKQSKTMRQGLIEDANRVIKALDKRIETQKAQILESAWPNSAALLAQCENMRPSVDDREYEKWKITIWRRNSAPHRVAQDQRHHARNSAQPSQRVRADMVPSEPISSFLAPDEDNVVSENLPKLGASDRIVDEADGHRSHLENDSAIQKTLSEFDKDSQQCPSISRPSTPAIFQGGKASGQPSMPTTPVNRIPTESSLFHSTLPVDLSDSSENTPLARAIPTRVRSESPPLEIPSRKLVKSKGATSTSGPLRTRRAAIATEVQYSSEPLDDTASMVDSWAMEDLVQRTDRGRILIKMLSMLTQEVRERMKMSLRDNKAHPVLVEEFLSYLGASEALDERGELMRAYLDLAQAWCEPQRAATHDKSEIAKQRLRESNIKTLLLFIKAALSKSKLFGTVMTATGTWTQAQEVVNLLSDSDDDPPSVKKRRNFKLKPSETAKKTQKQAKCRLERYSSLKELQSEPGSSQPLSLDIDALEHGKKIMVNPAKLDDDDAIYISTRIADKMKIHQINGVQFMWRELTAGDGENEPNQGCILAHTMGLGKTMQTIAILACLDSASRSGKEEVIRQLPPTLRSPDRRRQLRVLIICPPTLLHNWKREFNEWARKRFPNIWICENAKDHRLGLKEYQRWSTLGGILLMGYQMFNYKAKHSAAGKDPDDIFETYLLRTPDVIVADEAHTLKNRKAAVSLAASRFRTGCRIALTGTPMSNDVDEIYALISWIAPDYLGDPAEFRHSYSEPIKAGTYNDSSRQQVRRSLMKLAVLHNNIAPKVDRADITVLRGSLKPKVEFVITLPLLEIQTNAYMRYTKALLNNAGANDVDQVSLFSWLSVLTLLTNHPLAFKRKLIAIVDEARSPPLNTKGQPVPKDPRPMIGALRDLRRDTGLDQSENDDASSGVLSGAITPKDDVEADKEVELSLRHLTRAVVDGIVAGISDELAPESSAKTVLLMELVDLSKRCGDQMLIFSGSIPTLDYLEEVLCERNSTVGRIDGRVPMSERERLILDFTNGHLDIMIISTRAGGVGLNLQTANRVVLMDMGLNPSHEEQAIGRAYRLGQKKPVFVYRFVAGGTFEDLIYDKQIFKTSLSSRVIDKKNPIRTVNREAREWLHEPQKVMQQELSGELGKDPSVLDTIINKVPGPGTLIRALKLMETLQEEAKEPPLTAEEQLLVEEEIARNSRLGRTSRRSQGKAFPSTPNWTSTPYQATTGIVGQAQTDPPSATSAWNIQQPSMNQELVDPTLNVNNMNLDGSADMPTETPMRIRNILSHGSSGLRNSKFIDLTLD